MFNYTGDSANHQLLYAQTDKILGIAMAPLVPFLFANLSFPCLPISLSYPSLSLSLPIGFCIIWGLVFFPIVSCSLLLPYLGYFDNYG